MSHQIHATPLPDDHARTELIERRQKSDQKLKHRIRVLRALQRALTSLLSLLVLATMSGSLSTYFSTRNASPDAWPSSPTLYPTYALLAISGAVFLMDTIALFSYCCDVKAANRASSVSSYMHYATTAIHAVVWGAGAGVFKYANDIAGGSDLWGWSCSPPADVFGEINKSDLLCKSNTGSFYITIVQIVVELLGLVILCMSLRRSKSKKKLAALGKFDKQGEKIYGQAEQVEMEYTK